MSTIRKNQRSMPSMQANHCLTLDFDANDNVILQNAKRLVPDRVFEVYPAGLSSIVLIFFYLFVHCQSDNDERKWFLQLVAILPRSHYRCLIHFKYQWADSLNVQPQDSPSRSQTTIVLFCQRIVWRPGASRLAVVVTTKAQHDVILTTSDYKQC